MTVVSDTSPLHYLVLIEAEHVLAQLFSQVVVPPSVLRELSHKRAPERVRNWASTPPQWLHGVTPANVILDAKLGDGEAAAISLALEMRAKTLLIDERDVRGHLHEHDPALARVRCTAVAVSEIPRDETPARLTHSGGFLPRPSRLRLSCRDSCSSIAA